MIDFESLEQGVVITVKARAGARRNGITGIRQGMLCIAVTQAPERGKANKAIAGELANALQIRPSDVELLSGATSAKKRFLILGINVAQISERLVSVNS